LSNAKNNSISAPQHAAYGLLLFWHNQNS